MSALHDLPHDPRAEDGGSTARPLPWEHWSRARRQWTALAVAAALVLLGGSAAALSLWS